MDCLGTLCEYLHIRLLELVRFCYNGLRLPALKLGNRQIQHIRCSDVRELLVHLHKLGQVRELRKALFHAETIAGGFKLELRHNLAEIACPIVKILQSRSVEQVGTEITLHCVKLGHTVRHRRARGYTLSTQRTPIQSQSIKPVSYTNMKNDRRRKFFGRLFC